MVLIMDVTYESNVNRFAVFFDRSKMSVEVTKSEEKKET